VAAESRWANCWTKREKENWEPLAVSGNEPAGDDALARRIGNLAELPVSLTRTFSGVLVALPGMKVPQNSKGEPTGLPNL
jgi:hypothetical protein